MPNLYIIAGPNGAGKSTNSHKLIPAGLVAFDFDKTRLALLAQDKKDHPLKEEMAYNKTQEIFIDATKNAIKKKKDFAYETNFHSECMHWPDIFKKAGYQIHLFFVATNSIDTSIIRVELRVKTKGHSVSPSDIKERFNGSQNEVNKHFKKFDTFTLLDGSSDLTPILTMKKKQFEVSSSVPPYIIKLFKPIFKFIDKSKDKGLEL